MTTATIDPDTEQGRMAAVRRYDVLDTPPDGAFDRITRLASHMLGTPIAIVSIVDEDRIWFKSAHGLVGVEQIGRAPGLCASAIMHDEAWVVEDARTDPRTLANPLVAGDFGLQFYAGVPLRTADGYNLGTLCVLDVEPRHLPEGATQVLEDLAAIVMDELELRLAARRTELVVREREELLEARERQAVQLNDDIVQRLAVAILALQVGNIEAARGPLQAALDTGKRMLSEMARERPDLRRDSAPDMGEASGPR